MVSRVPAALKLVLSRARAAVSSVAILIGAASAACAMDSRTEAEPTAAVSSALLSGASAYVLVQSLTSAAESGPASTLWSYNSTGGTNYISWLGTGEYEVDFQGLGGSPNGNIQLTSVGGLGERCSVGYWTTSGTTLQSFVDCFTAQGQPYNASFEISYVFRSDTPGPEGAYLWAGSPSASGYGVEGYTWNSAGGLNYIRHTPGTGTYQVYLGGQNLSGGTVQVTGYGGKTYCKVGWWAAGEYIDVECFDGTTGHSAESAFDLVFSTKSPLSTALYTYAYASEPTWASYNPNPGWEHGSATNSCSSVPFTEPNATITHSESKPGAYHIVFPGMGSSPWHNNVIVTAYGTGSESCELTDWGGTTSNGTGFADILCTNAMGVPVDTNYVVTFSTTIPIVC
jgi:hypothetical protein